MMRNIANRDNHHQKIVYQLSVITKMVNGLLNKLVISFSRVANNDLFVIGVVICFVA